MKPFLPSDDTIDYESIVLENASDIIVTTDLDFHVRLWNKPAEDYYGVPAAEASGKIITDLVQFTFYGTSIEQAVIDVSKNGIWKGEVSFVNSRGETKYLLQTVKFIFDRKENKIGYLAVGRDITDRRRAEQMLAKSEQFYRTLIADSLDAILLTDENGVITFATPPIKNILGFNPEDVVNQLAFQFVHPDDLASARESFGLEVKESAVVKFIEIRLKRKDGTWLWCVVRGHNMLKTPGINSVVIYFQDDTLRKTATDALKASEQRFSDLIRDLQIGIIVQDKDGKTLLTNNAFRTIFNQEEQQLTGKDILNIVIDPVDEDGNKIKFHNRPTAKAIRTKQPVRDVMMGMYRTGEKERTWLLVNADPILNEHGEILHVICSVKDITERKKIDETLLKQKIRHQRQLTQATIDGQEKERLEIGKELHDNIGQQLTTVKLLLDLAQSSSESNGELISMAAKSVATVIDEVRTMSHSLVPSSLKDLGLMDSIQELIDRISRAHSINFHFGSFNFSEADLSDVQKVALFRILQEQVNNVVKHSSAKNVHIWLTSQGKEAVLQLKDDGHGFDVATVKKGLGLTTITNRAELLGGLAQFTSKPNQGCLMHVAIPYELIEA